MFRNKYGNKKTITDGITFASKKEAKRYNELRILKLAGYITDLETQKRFILQEKYTNNKGEHIRAIEYIADFYYYDREKNTWIAEDTKGFRTDVYKIKKKLFEYKYPEITFIEI